MYIFFCLFSIFEIYKRYNKKETIFFLSWGKRGDRQGDFRRAEAWRRSLRCCHEEDGHQDRRQGRRWASPLFLIICVVLSHSFVWHPVHSSRMRRYKSVLNQIQANLTRFSIASGCFSWVSQLLESTDSLFCLLFWGWRIRGCGYTVAGVISLFKRYRLKTSVHSGQLKPELG